MQYSNESLDTLHIGDNVGLNGFECIQRTGSLRMYVNDSWTVIVKRRDNVIKIRNHYTKELRQFEVPDSPVTRAHLVMKNPEEVYRCL